MHILLSLRCGLNLIRHNGHFQTKIAPICNLSINVTDFIIGLIEVGKNMNCTVKEKKVSHWVFWVIFFDSEHSYGRLQRSDKGKKGKKKQRKLTVEGSEWKTEEKGRLQRGKPAAARGWGTRELASGRRCRCRYPNLPPSPTNLHWEDMVGCFLSFNFSSLQVAEMGHDFGCCNFFCRLSIISDCKCFIRWLSWTS